MAGPQRDPLPPPDVEAFMAEIARGWEGAQRYTPLERYRDFRTVFLGSENGRRVLHQILAWAHVFGSTFDERAGVAAFTEGERNLALKIMAALYREPKELPSRQRKE